MAIEALTLAMVATLQPSACVVYKPAGAHPYDWVWECASCSVKWAREQVVKRRTRPHYQDPDEVLQQSHFEDPNNADVSPVSCRRCLNRLEEVTCLSMP